MPHIITDARHVCEPLRLGPQVTAAAWLNERYVEVGPAHKARLVVGSSCVSVEQAPELHEHLATIKRGDDLLVLRLALGAWKVFHAAPDMVARALVSHLKRQLLVLDLA